MTQFTDLRTDAERVRKIRYMINSLGIRDDTARRMSRTEVQDISDVLFHLESLLLKYQGRKDTLRFLESLGDVMHETASGLAHINDEINSIMVDNEISCERIREVQLSLCGERDENILAEASSKNFTKSTKKIDNPNYKLKGS